MYTWLPLYPSFIISLLTCHLIKGWSFISQVMYFTSHGFHKKTHVFHKKNLWNPWLVKYMTSRRPHQVMYFTSHVFHKSWISQENTCISQVMKSCISQNFHHFTHSFSQTWRGAGNKKDLVAERRAPRLKTMVELVLQSAFGIQD